MGHPFWQLAPPHNSSHTKYYKLKSYDSTRAIDFDYVNVLILRPM